MMEPVFGYSASFIRLSRFMIALWYENCDRNRDLSITGISLAFFHVFAFIRRQWRMARWWTGTMLMMILVFQPRINDFSFLRRRRFSVFCLMFTHRDTVDGNCRYFFLTFAANFTHQIRINKALFFLSHSRKNGKINQSRSRWFGMEIFKIATNIIKFWMGEIHAVGAVISWR